MGHRQQSGACEVKHPAPWRRVLHEGVKAEKERNSGEPYPLIPSSKTYVKFYQ